jgi:hypothetical protein
VQRHKKNSTNNETINIILLGGKPKVIAFYLPRPLAPASTSDAATVAANEGRDLEAPDEDDLRQLLEDDDI